MNCEDGVSFFMNGKYGRAEVNISLNMFESHTHFLAWFLLILFYSEDEGNISFETLANFYQAAYILSSENHNFVIKWLKALTIRWEEPG
jgi:hypothetical protein